MIKVIKSMIPKGIKNLFRSKELVTHPKRNKPLNTKDSTLGVMVAYNKYGGYCTPISSQHTPAVQKILKGSIYEPDTIEFIANNCGDGDIIHAGTFFGDFLPGLSQGLKKNAKIWAFEPNIENYKCAQITCLINNLKDVELFNVGLGSSPYKASMLVGTESGKRLGGRSKIISAPKPGIINEVKIETIDNMVPENRVVSIIQLDVEGFEKDALTGALKTIERCKPMIILEDNDKVVETKWFTDTFSRLGYKVKKKIHHNTLLTVD